MTGNNSMIEWLNHRAGIKFISEESQEDLAKRLILGEWPIEKQEDFHVDYIEPPLPK